jgi:lipopolysaccharide transport system ATP-binding protein
MSADDIAIKVENLSKCYHVYDKPRDRLLQMLSFGRKHYFREFWALRDVSFEIKKGETVGIIGRNGSGKSTLLQIICGTLNPTSGSVQTKGRIAALLELGSGFNPEFTGRENVYMNAAVLGLNNSEIDARFGDIETFADIGDFIDQPVKTYSSGMAVRLAFSISASIDPEVLIIDEALAVGDIRFQAKCFNRLKKLKDSGVTILLVSHSAEQIVKHCDRGILLEGGELLTIGFPKDVTNNYMDILYGGGSAEDSENVLEMSYVSNDVDKENSIQSMMFSSAIEDNYSLTLGWNPNEYRWGSGDAVILDFRIIDNNGKHTVQLYADEKFVIAMKVILKKTLPNIVFGFYIKTIDGLLITGSNSRDFPDDQHVNWEIDPGCNLFEVSFIFKPRLTSGEYMISLGVAQDVLGELIPLDRRYDSILIHVINRKPYFGLVDLDTKCLVNQINPKVNHSNG